MIMQGRVHYYEGYPMSDVVLPIRLMGVMGIKILLLTNAAGGINTDFGQGVLMMLTDHIATAVPNPLIGPNMEELGPSYESPAEIRMCRSWGADAVGMSTACEAIAARHMGIEVAGISCITNMAAGITGAPLSHEEVQETADRVAGEFKKLVTKIILNIL